MTREDYINTLELDNAELRKENEELKSQLRGTTHCFDEEEHNKLKEENQELKKYLKVPETCNLKTLEDYKSYYEDTTREQILEDTYIEYCAYVNLAHRYSELQKQLEDKTEDYKRMKDNFDGKVDVLTKIETQQKEFINYLEDEKDRLIKETCHYYIDSFDRQHAVNETIYDEVDVFLQKYKSIIGDDK